MEFVPPDGSRMSPLIPRAGHRFRDLYRRRVAVDRELGRLEYDYGLAPLRVRGLERVALHPTSRCSLGSPRALSRARAVPLAA
jgi:hypothetical protein